MVSLFDEGDAIKRYPNIFYEVNGVKMVQQSRNHISHSTALLKMSIGYTVGVLSLHTSYDFL